MFFSSKKSEGAQSPDALPTQAAAPAAANSMDTETIKKAIIQQVLIESNTNNARHLLGNINQHCSDACISKPGASLSTSEQTCATQCMEKYISAWNVVNAAYKSRLQQEIGSRP